jgi:hypothetical protein
VTTCTNAANYAFNPSPDIVAKLAFEPGFGHYEIFGVYSRFRDRIFPCEDVSSTATAPCGTGTTPGVPNASDAFNSSKNGGGVGANARWSFAGKRMDFGLHFLGGSGIGRYGAGGESDASVKADGSLALIKSLQGLGTLEWHGPKLDVYLNAGTEYAARTADYDAITGKYVGYGSPFFSNTGCYTETGPASGGFLPGGLSSCTADTRVLVEGTGGFWYKFYDGSKEKVNKGKMQFARNRRHDLHVVPLLLAVNGLGPVARNQKDHKPALGHGICPSAGFPFSEQRKMWRAEEASCAHPRDALY